MKNILAQLPSVDVLLKSSEILSLEDTAPRSLVKAAVQEVLARLRQEILSGERTALPTLGELAILISAVLDQRQALSLRRVINATGTVLHTNLGRSNLSPAVREHVMDIAMHYSNLEYDLTAGSRGSRYIHLVKVVKELTGAEDALVVNNNAAAVLLTLSTLVKGREVLISRGELVEIGGSFRIPEIIKLGGGTLCEVGTTNKTHLNDYTGAITENTGAIMKAHTSNYRIVGFTETVDAAELAKTAHKHGLPFINDLGSGLFIDMRRFGMPYEPTVRESLEQGCDIVTFSGDKLLGGPQAGIIVGRHCYIEQMKKNQLLRALRVDKMTMAALEATLRLYLDEEQAVAKVPVLQMMALTADDCEHKAERLAARLKVCAPQLTVSIKPDTDAVGGGSYPECMLPGWVVVIDSTAMTAEDIEKALRQAAVPVIARIKRDQVYLSVRTIDETEFSYVEQAVQALS